MIQTLIVEDEENSRNMLAAMLGKYCPQVEVIGYAADAMEAVEKIKLLQPTLLFLDIELPYGNAFDVLAKVGETDCHIVFTTAYDEYVLKAIKAGATDYLLKPIDHHELAETVQRIEKKLTGQRSSRSVEQLLAAMSKQLSGNNLALPTMDGYSFVKFDDIVRIEADGNYCRIHCINKQVHTITRQIHDLESKLPEAMFCRIHNSHIINLNYIREYVKGRGGYVVMADGSQVDVSHRRKDQFLERFT
jgi:two-component system LytT family response regulator